MINARCHCGNAQLELSLPADLSSYTPRACDCDFCVKRTISYLSDPKGNLTIKSDVKLLAHHHGSNQASFLSCDQCDDVVAVVCKINNQLRGAVNATLLNGLAVMKPSQIVSPKSLSADQKIERWHKLWLTVVID